MRFQRSVQVALQNRYRRMYKAKWEHFDKEAGYLLEYINDTPALRSIASSLADGEFDPAAWLTANKGHRKTSLPDAEGDRVALGLHLMKIWTQSSEAGPMFGMSGRDSLVDGARNSVEQVIEPVIEYLQERVEHGSDVLYLLERYVRRVEWFEKQRLWDVYESDTAHGEDVYDTDLRRFLFDQGVDYPFSQPNSASGQADIVAGVEGDDPLVCEVKLFNGDSYGKSYLAKGFRQAVRYAQDYGKTEAYLVVFNLSDKYLQLPTDGNDGDWPARLEADGVTVFLVPVHAKPMLSASRQKKPVTVTIKRSDLFEPESD